MLSSAIVAALLVGSAIHYAGWIPARDTLNESAFVWPYLGVVWLLLLTDNFLRFRATVYGDARSKRTACSFSWFLRISMLIAITVGIAVLLMKLGVIGPIV